jgi:sec-independent protein translocase protein TatA
MPVLGEILGWEILVPLALIALLFGSSKIPQLARSLGQAQHEFKKGIDEGHHSDPEKVEDAPPPVVAPAPPAPLEAVQPVEEPKTEESA